MKETIKSTIEDFKDRYDIFTVLLFNETNPYMVKMMMDEQYYMALHKITNDNLILFSAVELEGKKVFNKSKRLDSFEYIHPIWEEPEKNKELYDWFDIKGHNDLPLLVVFRFVDHEEMQFTKYKLDNTSIEEAYGSLEKVLKKMTTKLVKKEAKSGQEKFDSLKWEVKKLKLIRGWKSFKEFLKLIKPFTGYLN